MVEYVLRKFNEYFIEIIMGFVGAMVIAIALWISPAPVLVTIGVLLLFISFISALLKYYPYSNSDIVAEAFVIMFVMSTIGGVIGFAVGWLI